MLKILLVEDHRIYREVFKDFVFAHRPGMIIDEAQNGEEALNKIKEAPPNIIFMDIRLPGRNGLDLTREIKGAFPGIQVAILTGYDLPEYRQAAKEYGAEGFLVKESLTWEEVEAIINKQKG